MSLIVIMVIAGCAPSEAENIVSNTLKPVTTLDMSIQETKIMPKTAQQELIINLTPRQYTYEDLEYDISELKKLYGEIIHIDELCDTLDERNVYDIIIGDSYGENQILIFVI